MPNSLMLCVAETSITNGKKGGNQRRLRGRGAVFGTYNAKTRFSGGFSAKNRLGTLAAPLVTIIELMVR